MRLFSYVKTVAHGLSQLDSSGATPTAAITISSFEKFPRKLPIFAFVGPTRELIS
jgi:hypothetical protein